MGMLHLNQTTETEWTQATTPSSSLQNGLSCVYHHVGVYLSNPEYFISELRICRDSGYIQVLISTERSLFIMILCNVK